MEPLQLILNVFGYLPPPFYFFTTKYCKHRAPEMPADPVSEWPRLTPRVGICSHLIHGWSSVFTCSSKAESSTSQLSTLSFPLCVQVTLVLYFSLSLSL